MIRNISPKTLKALEAVRDYLYDDEELDYEECLANDDGKDHIFLSVKHLDKFLKGKVS